jgi:hypothetical protein
MPWLDVTPHRSGEICPACLSGTLYARHSEPASEKSQYRWLRCHHCPAKFKGLIPRLEIAQRRPRRSRSKNPVSAQMVLPGFE